jgi:hypothetical protein
MTRQIFMASLGFGVLILAAGQAFAQSNCAARSQVVERLASHYGESRRSIGLGADNRVMEVFASTETGTWTIVVTHPNGLSCLVASGRAFETLSENGDPKAGEGA